ncbi:MAG: glycosyltransferase family 2 protein [Planctomycetota bacterium]|jgi:glycosyltransferase involved in cell wall biosynthesis
MKDRDKRKRTLFDKLISGVTDARYRISEPYKLRAARKRREADYFGELPLVTIYTSTRNRRRILQDRALPSVLGQTYRNFEYLVVLHGCSDDTCEFLESVPDQRVRILQLPKNFHYPFTAANHWYAGPVDANNAALRYAKGLWLLKTDDDDILTENAIAKLLEHAYTTNAEFVSAAYEATRNGNTSVIKWGFPGIGGISTWLYRSYLKCFNYNRQCWRKKWNKPNDLDLALRMRKAGVRMSFLDEVVAQVRPRPNETTIGFDAYQELYGGDNGKSKA